MKNSDGWEQFLCTGKIEDYLSYREQVRMRETETEHKGAKPDAGTGQGYRDDLGSSPCR